MSREKVNDKADFTQGSILGKLIPFMIPILGALVLQAAYGAVDLLVVGRFGTTSGLSAVSTGSQAMGITVLIARYICEKRTQSIGALIGGSVVVFAVMSAVLFVIMIVFSRPIAVLMQAPEEAVSLTSVYVKICGSGIFFIVAYNVLSAIFRGLGDSKSPLIFVAVACVINIAGDLILVAGFRMDAAGAAIATVTAQGIVMSVMIIGIFVQKKDNVLKGIRLFARIPMEYVSGICKIGIPTALQGMAYCVISMVLARMVSVFGAEAVAVQRVGGQIESLSWNTADGFAAALNAFVGQNYGANKMDRVKKGYRASLWTVGIWGLIITAIFVFVPKPIARIFFHEATAIEIAVDYLIIVGLSEAFMCVELMTVGALSGLGKTHLCSVISIIFTGARIPLAILLCRTALGLNGIWCAVSSSSIVKGIIFVATFFWITRSSRILKNNSRL